MLILPSLILFIVTLSGGSIPLWLKGMNERRMNLLLAFSGSFLLSITVLHLLPETFEELGHKAGGYILAGFFLQLAIQKITHGAEHGHTHIHHDHHHHIPITSIFLGLTLHAFMEGLPLGFHYRMPGTAPALYWAVGAHKLPEAMLVTTLVLSNGSSRTKALLLLLLFSLVTPAASLLAAFLGVRYYAISEIVSVIIPVVAGAFIHIATTIFFESGTRQHSLTWQKVIAIGIGVALSVLTLFTE